MQSCSGVSCHATLRLNLNLETSLFIHANIPFRVDDESRHLLDSEAVRVQQEGINRLKERKCLTLLPDGWDNLLRRRLYGSLAVEVNHPPVVLALENMTGQRGTAENLVTVSQKAMDCTEVGDRKKFIAVTTDNPRVMQSYRHKLEQVFPWILPFVCFLHSLNTLIGDIMSFPEMKIVTQTTRVVTLFNPSHYCGGQLKDEANNVLEYRSPLTLVCMRPDAKKRNNGLAPVASEIVTTVKSIVDTIELLCAAKKMSQLTCEQDHRVGFWLQAISFFNRRFHAMNMEARSLALFLHPMCRKLAVTKVANGRSFEFMLKVALSIAKRWKWDITMAKKLSDDLQAYNQSLAPFADGQADSLSWWKSLPINSEIHPLKGLRSSRLLDNTQSARRCNLSVDTFETLGKIHANLRHHGVVKAPEAGKPTRRRHAHMHSREEVGIAVKTAQDLEASFAWAPPLSTEPRDADVLLAGPESISPDDIAAEFAALEELKGTEEVHNINEVEVLEGNADELDRVEQGIIPQAILDEVEVVDYDGEGGGWDEATSMSSLGMPYT
ncbi:hypothetical protein F4604DRAFT_1973927 [Suillus subluteus]|nr:hypothetical protein F4604DRAFT_1973927 [Suillus subluteus]